MSISNNVKARVFTFVTDQIAYFGARSMQLQSFFVSSTSGAGTISAWKGLIPDATVDPTDFEQAIVYLPEDPADWSGPERTHAEVWIATHGISFGKDAEVPLVRPNNSITYWYASAAISITAFIR